MAMRFLATFISASMALYAVAGVGDTNQSGTQDGKPKAKAAEAEQDEQASDSTLVGPVGTPKIELSKEVWELGEVWFGQTPKNTFTIKNIGDAPLKIKVKGSCACTVPKLAKSVLQPGDSTDVSVTFNSVKRPGKVNTTVTVTSNDPARPKAQFRLNGQVNKAVKMDPARGLYLTATDVNKSVSGVIRITNNHDQPLKPVLTPATNDTFEYELKEIEATKTYELHIKAKTPIRRGSSRVSLDLDTGIAGVPSVKIPINLLFRDRVTLSQKMVWISPKTKGESKRTIVLRYFGDRADFKVISAIASDPAVIVELKEPRTYPAARKAKAGTLSARNSPSLSIPISFTLPPPDQMPKQDVQVTVKTTDPDFPELTATITTNLNRFRRAMRNRAGVTAQAKAKRQKPKRDLSADQALAIEKLREAAAEAKVRRDARKAARQKAKADAEAKKADETPAKSDGDKP